jgi:replicative DNA helicase
MTGLSTGFVDLDKLTNGLQKSDLVIVAARPSMGKTALCMNIAEHAALHQDSPVVVFSLEMPSDQLMLRMMACLGKVELTKVRSGQLNQGELKSLMAAMTKLQKRPLFLDETAGLSPTEMRSRLRRLKSQEKKNPALIIIDYLQLMTTGKQSQSRTDEVSEISRQLKGIAKEFECPVVALSQLSRNVEKRDVKRPQMSDLRDSGAIEQDADIIAFIYRDDYYEKESSKRPGVADIIIAKHRNGPIGDVSLTFESKYTRFDNLARSSQRQAAEDAGF